jgi:hypothetical protein
MKIEIRFIGQSDKGRDKRLMDYVRECPGGVAEAERWARAVLARSTADERAQVKRVALVIDLDMAANVVPVARSMESVEAWEA